MTNTITNTSFTAINNMAENADYYTALSTIDRATIACMLFDAGYNSSYAKRINPSYPKRQQWDICKDKASDVIRYCKAVKGLIDSEGYRLPDNEDGWVGHYKYAVSIGGSFIDAENSREIYCPHGALECIIKAANLFDGAFHSVYLHYSKTTDGVKIHRLAQFTSGTDKTIRRASGRALAAEAKALYKEAIRNRNTYYDIKHGL